MLHTTSALAKSLSSVMWHSAESSLSIISKAFWHCSPACVTWHFVISCSTDVHEQNRPMKPDLGLQPHIISSWGRSTLS